MDLTTEVVNVTAAETRGVIKLHAVSATTYCILQSTPWSQKTVKIVFVITLSNSTNF